MASGQASRRQGATEEQRSRAWNIVHSHGHTPLARFALFEDKSYFFSAGGSVVAFVLQGKTAIALGDPIGPGADFSSSIAEFKDFCGKNHFLPVFYQVLPDRLEDYALAGLDALCIGHDAIIDLSTFTLTGPGSKNVRNSFHKLARLGYQAQVCDPPHPPAILFELEQVSQQWLADRGGFEIGFSLGRLNEEYLNTTPVILVRDPAGCARAFANIVFEFRADEAIIDLMRYCPGGPNGQMDFLFASLLQWAKGRGLATLNLGFSPFIGIGVAKQSSVIERALRVMHEHATRYPNFKGLHFFKEKFNPAWGPRYLVYPGTISLPRVAIGIMRAYQVPRLLGHLLFRRG
jgi:phosphatidylglycerol lysyltransferase